jgi:hypothetical protein
MGKEVRIIYKKGSPIPESISQFPRIEYDDSFDLLEKLKKED